MNTSYVRIILGIAVIGLIVLLKVSFVPAAPTHPIGYSENPDSVHVHSDFILFVNGEQYDLSTDEYQSSAASTLHAHIHLHDNQGNVIHRHAPDVTLGDFFTSLGFSLSDECLTLKDAATFCTNATNTLVVYVNNEPITDFAQYVNQEEDKILIYYGENTSETINALMATITDDACYYSGTCPERGTPPAEGCGLTCEI